MQLRSSSRRFVAVVLALALAAACETSNSGAPVTGTTFGPYDAAVETGPS
jgi:hypothetical protein